MKSNPSNFVQFTNNVYNKINGTFSSNVVEHLFILNDIVRRFVRNLVSMYQSYGITNQTPFRSNHNNVFNYVNKINYQTSNYKKEIENNVNDFVIIFKLNYFFLITSG